MRTPKRQVVQDVQIEVLIKATLPVGAMNDAQETDDVLAEALDTLRGIGTADVVSKKITAVVTRPPRKHSAKKET